MLRNNISISLNPRITVILEVLNHAGGRGILFAVSR